MYGIIHHQIKLVWEKSVSGLLYKSLFFAFPEKNVQFSQLDYLGPGEVCAALIKQESDIRIYDM